MQQSLTYAQHMSVNSNECTCHVLLRVYLNNTACLENDRHILHSDRQITDQCGCHAVWGVLERGRERREREGQRKRKREREGERGEREREGRNKYTRVYFRGGQGGFCPPYEGLCPPSGIG